LEVDWGVGSIGNFSAAPGYGILEAAVRSGGSRKTSILGNYGTSIGIDSEDEGCT